MISCSRRSRRFKPSSERRGCRAKSSWPSRRRGKATTTRNVRQNWMQFVRNWARSRSSWKNRSSPNLNVRPRSPRIPQREHDWWERSRRARHERRSFNMRSRSAMPRQPMLLAGSRRLRHGWRRKRKLPVKVQRRRSRPLAASTIWLKRGTGYAPSWKTSKLGRSRCRQTASSISGNSKRIARNWTPPLSKCDACSRRRRSCSRSLRRQRAKPVLWRWSSISSKSAKNSFSSNFVLKSSSWSMHRHLRSKWRLSSRKRKAT
mmetsp:Transcript_26113/g.62255  ORF Transcript_26113/g.62255 Transcript_26113/m.62255 type:complete len:261 (-) Transcript_26113:2016-2798(-)